jgi:hypothetical protein
MCAVLGNWLFNLGGLLQLPPSTNKPSNVGIRANYIVTTLT